VVKVEDSPPFQIELDLFSLCDLKEVLPSLDGKPDGLNRIRPIIPDARNKFGEPAVLVVARPRVQQQWGLSAEHPLQSLDDSAPGVPDLGIAGG
jgi:hypothetical protein